MSTLEVGERLLSLLREGRTIDAVKELYSPDVVSLEARSLGEQPREQHGIDWVLGKMAWWNSSHLVHDIDLQGPFPNGDDRFAVFFDLDVTQKESEVRMEVHMVGVYTVDGGKIVREELFHGG